MAAKTFLCYGIPVTNESLTYATMAYADLQGPFRFIRLVQQRIRAGTLRTVQHSVLALFPVELWDLVRHQVTDLELRAAERRFLREHCGYCLGDCACRRDSRPVKDWAELLGRGFCIESVEEYDGFESPDLIKQSRRLLRDYGLDMPSKRVLKATELTLPDKGAGDPASAAFIALPPASTADAIDAADHVSYEEPTVNGDGLYFYDGIWSLALDKPADADLRFRKLLRDMHLTPLIVRDGTIGNTIAAGSGRKRTYEKISAAEVQPQWQLFTMVQWEWF
ncbi:hypothetical protein JCM3774_003814 [Rhodotorula dairenensis]